MPLSAEDVIKVYEKGVKKYVTNNVKRSKGKYVENSLRPANLTAADINRDGGAFGDIIVFSAEFYVGSTAETERCFFVCKVESQEGIGREIMLREEQIKRQMKAGVKEYMKKYAVNKKDAPIAVPLRSYAYETENVKARATLYKFCQYMETNGVAYSDLEKLMERTTTADLTIEEIDRILRMMLEAVQFLHRLKIAHCDIKPANFLVARSNYNKKKRNNNAQQNDGKKEKMVVKLADFGGCKFCDENGIALEYGVDLYTTAYCCPEMLLNHPYSRYRRDLWAVGVTLYELVNLISPFTPDRPADKVARKQFAIQKHAQLQDSYLPHNQWRFEELTHGDPDLIRKFEKLMMMYTKALSWNPNDRYATAGEWLEKLKQSHLSSKCKEVRKSIVDVCHRIFPQPTYENAADMQLVPQSEHNADQLHQKVVELRTTQNYGGEVWIAKYDAPADGKGFKGKIDLFKDDVLYNCKPAFGEWKEGMNFNTGKQGKFKASNVRRYGAFD